MTLLECLNKFDDDEKLIDFDEIEIKTNKKGIKVSQLKEMYKNDTGNYWISEHKYNYGKKVKKTITCRFGNVFIQK